MLFRALLSKVFINSPWSDRYTWYLGLHCIESGVSQVSQNEKIDLSIDLYQEDMLFFEACSMGMAHLPQRRGREIWGRAHPRTPILRFSSAPEIQVV